jgi:hypothetical protein
MAEEGCVCPPLHRSENRQGEGRPFCSDDVILKPRVLQRGEGSRAEYFKRILAMRPKQGGRAIKGPPITYVT